MRILLMMIFLGSATATAQPAAPVPAAPPGQAKTRMGVSVTVIHAETLPQPKAPQGPDISR